MVHVPKVEVRRLVVTVADGPWNADRIIELPNVNSRAFDGNTGGGSCLGESVCLCDNVPCIAPC